MSTKPQQTFDQERQDIADALYECHYTAIALDEKIWAEQCDKLRHEVLAGDHDGSFAAIQSTLRQINFKLGHRLSNQGRIEGAETQRLMHLKGKLSCMVTAREALDEGDIGQRDPTAIAMGFHMWELIGQSHSNMAKIRSDRKGALWQPLSEFCENHSEKYGNKQTERWRQTLKWEPAKAFIDEFNLIPLSEAN